MGNDLLYPSLQYSQFIEQRVTQRTPLFELKSIYGISALRDITTTEGSATLTNAVGDGEYKLSTTASGTDKAILESAEVGRYIPGAELESGIGVRIPESLSGNQVARWGYFDDNNGFFFGMDADGLFLGLRRDGSDTTWRPSQWSGDAANGNGPTRLNLDPARGNIYLITFSWYGYGSVEWQALIPDSVNQQERLILHRFAPSGQTSIKNPNQRIRIELDNNGTAAASDLFVGGRRCEVVGRYAPNRRINSERRLERGSVGNTLIPLVSVRRKSAYDRVSVKIDGFDIVSTSNLVIEIRTGASLTGASFGTPTNTTASETAIEADASATALSGGEMLYSSLIGSDSLFSDAFGGSSRLNFDFIGTDTITLAARKLPSANSATVTSVLRWAEEW